MVISCPFTPPKNQKNQNLDKIEKIAGDIIILHMCTKNHDHDVHSLYASFLSFWAIFCPSTPQPTQKIKILKKWKKMPGDIILLHMCTINEDHMIYGSWEIRRTTHNFSSFWATFCPFYPTDNPENQNIVKINKNAWRYYPFTHVYHKWWYDV